MNCRSRECLSTPIYTNHHYNYKTPDLFSLSRIFTDLIMHNYRPNQSALMTRCGTDLRHQYGIFGGESQTSVSRNATRPGAKKDGCFRRLIKSHLCFLSFLKGNYMLYSYPSLQNRRISGASAIQEGARETRKRARSARQEISACKHTIVYALPTVRLANGFC